MRLFQPFVWSPRFCSVWRLDTMRDFGKALKVFRASMTQGRNLNHQKSMSKIIQLQTENVKRLKAVTIKPDGTLVIIGGKNAQGKTSVLDSIAMALGGKDQIPSMPIRKGETKASTVVDLGDIVVKRTFTAAGGGTLVIEDKDKKRYPSPQALLDSLAGRMTFDPLSFLTLKPAQQLEELRKLVGLDFTADDKERERIYNERTLVNREVERAKHAVASAQSYPDVTASVDVSALNEELKAANEHNGKLSSLRIVEVQAQNEVTSVNRAVESNQKEIDELKARIAELQRKLTAATELNARLLQQAEQSSANADTARQAVTDFPKRDVESIQRKLADAHETNRKHGANQAKKTLADNLQAKQKESEDLTAQINAIDERKEKKLSAAKFPVAGLAFGSGEVLFAGIPLSQASDAERMRVSVAMAAAMNPKVRVALVRNGSLLDADNLALLENLAAEHDLQVWIERVGTADPSAVIIEDGQVKESAPITPVEAPKAELALEAQ